MNTKRTHIRWTAQNYYDLGLALFNLRQRGEVLTLTEQFKRIQNTALAEDLRRDPVSGRSLHWKAIEDQANKIESDLYKARKDQAACADLASPVVPAADLTCSFSSGGEPTHVFNSEDALIKASALDYAGDGGFSVSAKQFPGVVPFNFDTVEPPFVNDVMYKIVKHAVDASNAAHYVKLEALANLVIARIDSLKPAANGALPEVDKVSPSVSTPTPVEVDTEVETKGQAPKPNLTPTAVPVYSEPVLAPAPPPPAPPPSPSAAATPKHSFIMPGPAVYPHAVKAAPAPSPASAPAVAKVAEEPDQVATRPRVITGKPKVLVYGSDFERHPDVLARMFADLDITWVFSPHDELDSKLADSDIIFYHMRSTTLEVVRKFKKTGLEVISISGGISQLRDNASRYLKTLKKAA